MKLKKNYACEGATQSKYNIGTILNTENEANRIFLADFLTNIRE